MQSMDELAASSSESARQPLVDPCENNHNNNNHNNSDTTAAAASTVLVSEVERERHDIFNLIALVRTK